MLTMFQAEELATLACHTAVTATLAFSPDRGVYRLNPEVGIALADAEEADVLDKMTQIACTLWFDDITSGGGLDPLDDLYTQVLHAWASGVLD